MSQLNFLSFGEVGVGGFRGEAWGDGLENRRGVVSFCFDLGLQRRRYVGVARPCGTNTDSGQRLQRANLTLLILEAGLGVLTSNPKLSALERG